MVSEWLILRRIPQKAPKAVGLTSKLWEIDDIVALLPEPVAKKRGTYKTMMDDSKTRAYCLENLEEAIAQLTAATKLFHSAIVDEQEYKKRMAHVYWSVNLAWNCRNLSYIEVEAESFDQNNSYAEFYPEDLEPNDISN